MKRTYISLFLAVFLVCSSFLFSYKEAEASALNLAMYAAPALDVPIAPVLAVTATVLAGAYVWDNRDKLVSASSAVFNSLTQDVRDAIQTAVEAGQGIASLSASTVHSIINSVQGLSGTIKDIYTFQGIPVFDTPSDYRLNATSSAYSMGQSITIDGTTLTLVKTQEASGGYPARWALQKNGAIVNALTTFEWGDKTISINASNYNIQADAGTKPYFVLEHSSSGSVALDIYTKAFGTVNPAGFSFTSVASVPATPTVTWTAPASKVYTIDDTKPVSVPVSSLDTVGTKELVFEGNAVKEVSQTGTGSDTATDTVTESWLGQKIDAIIDAITGVVGAIGNVVDAIHDTAINLVVPQSVTLDLDAFNTIGDRLKTVFPFSLPFDIRDAISTFVDVPKAPKFTIDLRNTPFVGGSVTTLDFAQFEEWARITRWAILVIFNISLIVITRRIMS